MYKQKMHYRMGLILMIAAAALLLAACGGDDPESESVTLTFWNGFTGPDGEVLEEIVDQYNSQRDAIEIDMDIIPWDQLGQRLPPAIATDTGPSFAALIQNLATAYVNAGSLQPLDTFFEETGFDQSEFTAASLELGRHDGNQYLLPFQVNGLYLFWNKTLFQEAGLDPDTGPETLNEMVEFATRITDPDANRYGMALPASGAPEYYVSFIRANGGEVIDQDSMTSALNSEQNIETFTWLQNAALEQEITPIGAPQSDMDNFMLSGQLGMIITGPWLAPGLENNSIDYGVSVPPAGSDGRATPLGGIGFAIPATTEETQVSAVYDFISFWYSDEIAKRWALEIGFPPYLQDVIADPDVQNNPNVSAMSELDGIARPFLHGITGAAQIHNDVMLPLIEEIQNGGDVRSLIEEYSDQINTILAAER